MEQTAQHNTVYRMTWTEYERGWGQRPDGASLHATKQDAVDFYDRHFELERERNPSGNVPDEYSNPDQDPRVDVLEEITIADDIYQDVVEHGSIWEPRPVRLGA